MVVFFFLIILFFSACRIDLDMEQLETFHTIEKWDGSIFYFNLKGRNFYFDSIPQYSLNDTIPFELFNKSFIRKGFIRIELETYAVNTLSSSFQLKIYYLKDAFPLDTLVMDIPSGSVMYPQEIHLFKTKDNSSLPPFTDFNHIAVQLMRQDTTDIRNAPGKLTLGVNFNLYLQIE